MRMTIALLILFLPVSATAATRFLEPDFRLQKGQVQAAMA